MVFDYHLLLLNLDEALVGGNECAAVDKRTVTGLRILPHQLAGPLIGYFEAADVIASQHLFECTQVCCVYFYDIVGVEIDASSIGEGVETNGKFDPNQLIIENKRTILLFELQLQNLVGAFVSLSVDLSADHINFYRYN